MIVIVQPLLGLLSLEQGHASAAAAPSSNPQSAIRNPQSLRQFPGSGKGLEAAVVSLFRIRREAAAGKLLGGQMITDAFAAHAFVIAPGIGATAVLQVLRLLTFHRPYLLMNWTSAISRSGAAQCNRTRRRRQTVFPARWWNGCGLPRPG